MTKEVLQKLKDIKTPSDVCDNIVSLLDEASKIKHLEQDASAMFDESGNYNPDWANS